MSTQIRQVNNAGIRVFMGTMTNRADLHQALAQTAIEHEIKTATFQLLGGLHQLQLTAFDFQQQKRHPPITFNQPMEIVAGHGTISQLENAPHIHTHLTVSFRDEGARHGISIVGGHAAQAICFAVEFTLTAYDGIPIHRALHPATGLMLWAL